MPQQGHSFKVMQVMLHSLGHQQADDKCILQEDDHGCFLELAATSDGQYVTINSNAKTASEVRFDDLLIRSVHCMV